MHPNAGRRGEAIAQQMVNGACPCVTTQKKTTRTVPISSRRHVGSRDRDASIRVIAATRKSVNEIARKFSKSALGPRREISIPHQSHHNRRFWPIAEVLKCGVAGMRDLLKNARIRHDQALKAFHSADMCNAFGVSAVETNQVPRVRGCAGPWALEWNAIGVLSLS
jgi:hypothetical protein